VILLVDTSIWIEFFKSKPSLDLHPLELAIEERRVATCLPILAEVLSGGISSKMKPVLLDTFEAMIQIDLDWNSKTVWQEIVSLALKARIKGLGIPGLIDRMILLAAKESHSTLWTLDQKLKRLALLEKLEML